ncbi:histone-like nucleoid-structuring protein Lsr2 [Kitasatospora purpeofusca]|uniref:Lsr2 family DNA-binding protein n=1 Tax=Kitasatospora purpeofusca TaxID=67352 RepID=UPI0036D341EC
MSSPVSSPPQTWRSLLSWLDRVSGEQALTLQGLGGPAQWWLHEGPAETESRRHYLKDILDTLGSFLETKPFDEEPLGTLLPTVPPQRSTSSLDLNSRTLTALKLLGGATLRGLRSVTPADILAMHTTSYRDRRECLVVLVRAATLPETMNMSETHSKWEQQPANLEKHGLTSDDSSQPVTYETGSPAEARNIRAWAIANGFAIAERGRLSEAVRDAYKAAHRRPETTRAAELRPADAAAPGARAANEPHQRHAETDFLHSGAAIRAEAIKSWFASLDNRQQDLITLHLCAQVPHTVDDLATQHRITRARMVQLLHEIPQQFDSAAAQNGAMRNALILLNQATSTPVTGHELITRHPWLGVVVPGTEVTVLQVLIEVRWSGSMQQGWLYSDSLHEARRVTQQALSLELGERMSVTAATQLLAKTGWQLVPTEAWLRFCGLSLVSNHVQLDPAKPADHSGGLHARRRDIDYALAPAQDPETRGEQVHGPETPVAHHSRTQQPPVGDERHAPVGVRQQFTEALDQLHEYVRDSHPGVRLADLLRGDDQFHDEIGTLTARILAASAGPEGWTLPAEASDASALGSIPTAPASIDRPQPGAEVPAGLEPLADEVPASLREAAVPMSASPAESFALVAKGVRGTLKDRAREVLEELSHPLPSQLLADRMGANVNLRSLKAQLQSDPRFMRSDVDSWGLREWDLRPYTTIKELVGQEVARADGEIPTEELVEILTREFSINESSVRQVASTHPFTARGGIVRQLDYVGWADDTSGEPQVEANTSIPAVDDGPSVNDLIDLMGLS